jgi:predicted porin
VQYIDQNEISNSGIEADIYGVMGEFIVYNIGFNLAYNRSLKNKGKDSFAGFGGGALFTNMDTMILNEITRDRDSKSIVTGLSYDINNLSFLYAYGSFRGDPNSLSEKAHIVEQNMGVEYNYNDEFVGYLIYVKSDDKYTINATDSDFKHIRVMVNYNF